MPKLQVLPGIGSLGQGFDIFGRYDDSSLKTPLFDMDVEVDGDDSAFNVVLPSGKVFARPFNTQANLSNNPARSAALVFSSKQAYVEHLEVKAEIKASYRAFTGAFKFAFNIDRKEESQFSYAVYEYEKQFWSIQIVDPSAVNLANHVLSDPDFKNVPQVYTPDNAHLFYRFFHKYGTHFVRSVDVGARLNYCVSVKKSFISDKMAIKTKLDAEIDAVFVSGETHAEANWNKAGKEWAEAREVRIDVLGGDNAHIAALRPGYEQNFNLRFDRWVDSLAEQPGTINFRLSPIEELFSGDQAGHVRRAAAAYADSQLQVVSEGREAMILLNGSRLDMDVVGPKLPDHAVSLMKIAVIDGDTLQPVHKRAYRIAGRDFAAAMNDMKAYERDDKYIVVVALTCEPGGGYGAGYSGVQFPTGDFYAFLLGIGGGEAIETWHDKYHHSSADYSDLLTLAFIGCSGAQPDSGIGVLGHNDGGQPVPRVEARAFLRPVGIGGASGDKIRFKPEAA